jgi:uncharacterized Tic20 family protein
MVENQHHDDERRLLRLTANGAARAGGISDQERRWAALAHASIWVTLLGGLLTLGFAAPLTVFIPLVIFLVWRKKSDYVAFHALQAFVLQLVSTVGVLFLAVVGGTVWALGMVIALIAVFVLAGIILVPLWGIVGIALLLVVGLLPFVTLFLGTMAAVQTYNRTDYHYPRIGIWVERQLTPGV